MGKDNYLLIEEGINKLKSNYNITFLFIALSVGFFSSKIYDLGFVFFLISGFFSFHNIKYYFTKKESDNHNNRNTLKRVDINVNRVDIAHSILNKIFNSKSNAHVLVGTSGAGKSELIKRYFQKALNKYFPGENKQLIHIENYTNFENELNNKIYSGSIIKESNLWDTLNAIEFKNQLFIVLDQFESLFLIDQNTVQKQLVILCQFFDYAKLNAINVLIVIRKEWYFNLKFFQDYIPHIKDVHIVDGFNSDSESAELKIQAMEFINNDDLVDALIDNCKRIRKPELYYITTCKEFDNFLINNNEFQFQLLPIEIITVLDSLSVTSKKKMSKISKDDYLKDGGKKTAIRKYFEELLLLSKNEKDAARVLFALSVEPKINRRLDGEEISVITNVDLTEVNRILTFYYETEKKHIIEIDGKFDWRHDFYAEKFNEISGTLLDPIDRDNINFLWTKNNNKKIKPDRLKVDKDILNKNQKLGIVVFVMSVLFLFLKMCMPGIKVVLPLNFSVPFVSIQLFTLKAYQYKIVDYSFLPIAICLTMWSWYVTTLFRRLFARIKESNVQILFSKFVCWWSFICVGLTIVLPEFWLTFSGIGGIVVALKYFQITRQIKSHFEIKRLSRETLINSLVLTIVVGPVYAFLFPRFSLYGTIADWAYLLISVVTMAIMIYFARMSIRNHVSQYKIPMFLGLYNRTLLVNDKSDE